MTTASISPSRSDPPRVGKGLDLPDGLAAVLWRGNELGTPSSAVVTTGFDVLDHELPGGGWPVGCAKELLQPQYSLAEAQLLLPAVSRLSGAQRQVLVIGAPHQPFLAGWLAWGICEAHVLVVQPHTPAESLWVTEQAVRADGIGAVMAWLPHARADQVRRLQACASGSDFPVFLMRPQDAALQSSAAPLRVQARLAGPGQIAVHVLKRRGPAHDGELVLATASPRLAPLLQLRRSSPDRFSEGSRHVLDRAASRALQPQRLGLVGR
jgi:protein ImuA